MEGVCYKWPLAFSDLPGKLPKNARHAAHARDQSFDESGRLTDHLADHRLKEPRLARHSLYLSTLRCILATEGDRTIRDSKNSRPCVEAQSASLDQTDSLIFSPNDCFGTGLVLAAARIDTDRDFSAEEFS